MINTECEHEPPCPTTVHQMGDAGIVLPECRVQARPYEPPMERHDEDTEPPCVGQWCCGCRVHPLGKPWGANSREWDEHVCATAEKGSSSE